MRLPSFNRSVATLGLMWICAAAASAPAQERPRPVEGNVLPAYPIVTATGHGEVNVAPDRAVVRLGAEAQETEAAAAQQKVNDIVQKAVDEIAALGVKKEQIRTSRVTLQPIYRNEVRPPRGPQQQQQQEPSNVLVGYRANNIIEVRVDDLKQVGGVLDAGVKSGATNIEGLSFELSNNTPATLDALRSAAGSAKAKAQAMAEALGLKLGTVVEVAQGSAPRPIPMMGRAMMAMAAPAPGGGAPVQPGEIKVEAEVTVTYRLTDK